MPHEPVATLAEYDALDPDEVFDGHRAARGGDPEPGEDRSRAYWHGWRIHMMAIGAVPITYEHLALAEAVRLRIDRGSYN